MASLGTCTHQTRGTKFHAGSRITRFRMLRSYDLLEAVTRSARSGSARDSPVPLMADDSVWPCLLLPGCASAKPSLDVDDVFDNDAVLWIRESKSAHRVATSTASLRAHPGCAPAYAANARSSSQDRERRTSCRRNTAPHAMTFTASSSRERSELTNVAHRLADSTRPRSSFAVNTIRRSYADGLDVEPDASLQPTSGMYLRHRPTGT